MMSPKGGLVLTNKPTNCWRQNFGFFDRNLPGFTRRAVFFFILLIILFEFRLMNMKLTHLTIVAFYLAAFCYVASGERNGKSLLNIIK